MTKSKHTSCECIDISLLVNIQQFVDTIIFDHCADAVTLHDNDYQTAKKISKQISTILSKCKDTDTSINVITQQS